jgi:tetratricopeptide (TPR) repeat protein
VRFLLLAGLLGVTLAGCQRAPALAPAASVEIVGSLTSRLKAEGDELLKQGQYEQAAVKYQAALNQAPNDVPIRFGLAVALSNTNRREETVEHFRFVLQHGTPGSAEVNAAREWLAGARELEGAEPSTTAAAPSETTPLAAPDPKKGHVLGKIAWGDIEPRTKMVRVNVSLIGDEAETREVRMARPDFKIGKGYEFRNVPPGAYRLLAEVGGTPMWDLKVVVPAEKDTTLDLTDGNASVAKDFTPPGD